ncbi:MAG: pyridoxamine 5'-phosphate oxidase family protein [Candidatus Levybacteria bacterium]|nr:pyridoxamine 5'-phosphate oxidase family protein [Candidatus Levybacteria bacterium]
MKTNKFNWKKYIDEALAATDYCSIATVDKNGVWSNPAYFAWDHKYNLYFISQMKSRHMQNIKADNRTSVSIYKTEQKDDVLGIQLEGAAKILSEKDSKEEIQHAFETYYGRAGRGPDVQGYINNPIWLYVKITPLRIYYFDTRFFDEERKEVPLRDLTK